MSNHWWIFFQQRLSFRARSMIGATAVYFVNVLSLLLSNSPFWVDKFKLQAILVSILRFATWESVVRAEGATNIQ